MSFEFALKMLRAVSLVAVVGVALCRCAPIDSADDTSPPESLDSAVSKKLAWANKFTGHKLFLHVTASRDGLIYTVSRAQYDQLDHSDKRTVGTLAELLTTGEWRQLGTLPTQGVSVIVHDENGRVIESKQHVHTVKNMPEGYDVQ